MTSPADLSHAAWLTAAPTRTVTAALKARGGEDAARFVGGCVRNSLLGRAVDDVDIATRLRPEQTMAALERAGLKAVPTGLAHGTVTAVAAGHPFEITTLRRDVATDGRRATVAFTDDWAEDAARRDFHINALYADDTGQVFDPTGRGLADIAARRVAFVGDPARRLAEDRLRLLRFFRFHAWYGSGPPDAEGLQACVAAAGGLAALSAERVSKEVLKLLAAPDPSSVVAVMSGTGIWSHLLPWPVDQARFEAMVAVTDDPLLRLSALLPEDPGTVEAMARRLRLSNRQALRLTALAHPNERGATVPDAHSVRVWVYREGREAALDRLIRLKAQDADRAAELSALEAVARDWPRPRLPVGGRDVARLGVPPGPVTGAVLEAFEDGWVADDFPDHGHEARLMAAVARCGG